MRRVLMLTVPVWVLGFAAAQADEATPVEPVTVTATRTAKPVDQAPATVSVISSQQIDDQLVNDIKDLVRYEPGVAVRRSPARFTAAGSSTGRDGDSGFNIRGLEGDRVLIQIDGVRIPDAYSFGPQSVGRGDYADLGLLKSVEILRGPASALYGGDGLAGAVSYVTKDPEDFLKPGQVWGGQARVGYASQDDSWSEGATVAGRDGPWGVMLAYTRRDGHELDNKGSNGVANIDRTTPNPQDSGSNAALAKLVYAPSDTHRVRLTWDHLDSQLDTNVLSAIAKPPLTATSAVGLRAQDDIKRDRLSLDYRYKGDGGPISAGYLVGYFQTSRTEQFSFETRNTALARTRLNTFDNRVYGLSGQLESRLTTGAVEHHFVYGGDVSLTRQTGVRDGTVPSMGDSFPTRAFPVTDYVLAGLFVQDEIGLMGGRLNLYPALRYDYYDLDPKADPLFTTFTPRAQSDGRLTPRLAAVFQATPNIGLFANYAQGFKSPEPSQVNNGFSNPIINYRSVPNPDLKPETSQTLEAGARFKGRRWSASVTGFAGWYDDFIEQVQVSGSFTPTDPALFKYVNLGEMRITGVEAKAEAELGHGLTGRLAASYARGTQKSDGVSTPLASIEPFKLVAGLGWREPAGRFGGQLSATYSDGKSRSRTGGTCAPNCFTPPSFTVVDLTGWWSLGDRAVLRAGVFNLFDQKYWWWSDVRGLSTASTVTDAYTQPGRNAGASLTVRF